MTQTIPRIDNGLDFETVKQRITEMIDEIEQETDSSLNEDEKLEVASEMMGHLLSTDWLTELTFHSTGHKRKSLTGLPLGRLKQERRLNADTSRIVSSLNRHSW